MEVMNCLSQRRTGQTGIWAMLWGCSHEPHINEQCDILRLSGPVLRPNPLLVSLHAVFHTLRKIKNREKQIVRSGP